MTQPNHLVVNCNRGITPTRELAQEAARLRADVVCGNAPGAVLEVDYSTVDALRLAARQTRVSVQPNGHMNIDDSAYRQALRGITQQFQMIVHQSNIEEIISQQIGRPVNVSVRGQSGR